MRVDTQSIAPAALARVNALRRLPRVRLGAPPSLSQAQRPLPWRAIGLQTTALWCATRVAYLLLTYYFPLVTGGESPSLKPVYLPALARVWLQRDAPDYILIAQSAYPTSIETVYFPLYPLTVRLVATFIGPHWVAAALIASNLSALLAFLGVAYLAAQLAPAGQEAQVARVAMMLLATYPLAYFLTVPYSDGMFAGLAAFTLFFALRRRWGWAAACAFLAALTRPIGPALIIPLAWEAFQSYRAQRALESLRQTLRQTLRAVAGSVGAVCAPIAAIALYCGYLWLRFGDPLIFMKAEAHWNHFSLSPLLSIPLALLAFAHVPMLSTYQSRILLDLIPVLLGIIVTAATARRAPLACTLYTIGVLYIITSEPLPASDLFISAGRYMLAAVPLFALGGVQLRDSKWLLPTLYWSGVVMQTMFCVYFLTHGWVV